MSDVVIRAEGLGKAYQIRHEAERRHDRFSEMLAERARRLFRRGSEADPTRETFWALRDVSFEVREGEVVGIIGRNGAGKSTLLKILSRITEPTEGRAEIRGRVASLLEVGTGFHPELTGRENVFLNGAILGMSRAEIRRKFDEIVDFAGVEKFLDTPVKRYSSGMRVRLAFAVAAHLEPEILIVDEVLAVGDAEFQRKCLGKMGEVAKGGRTVLFVSHNHSAVARLCGRAIWLGEGRVQGDGSALDMLTRYNDTTLLATHSIHDRHADAPVFIKDVVFATERSAQPPILNTDALVVKIRSCVQAPVRDMRLSVDFFDSSGRAIFATGLADASLNLGGKRGIFGATVKVPPLSLLPGNYLIRVTVWNEISGIKDVVEDVQFFVEADAASPIRTEGRSGSVTLPCTWSLVEEPEAGTVDSRCAVF